MLEKIWKYQKNQRHRISIISKSRRHSSKGSQMFKNWTLRLVGVLVHVRLVGLNKNYPRRFTVCERSIFLSFGIFDKELAISSLICVSARSTSRTSPPRLFAISRSTSSFVAPRWKLRRVYKKYFTTIHLFLWIYPSAGSSWCWVPDVSC